MDVPAVNTSFTHPHPQAWAGQNHMTPAMSPTSWKPNPTCPPPYHYPYMNPTHQSTGASLAPMTHTPVTCSGARPQSLYWDNSHQSYQGKNNRKHLLKHRGTWLDSYVVMYVQNNVFTHLFEDLCQIVKFAF